MAKKKEYKVVKAFKDKNTSDIYASGDSYEADAKRLKELQKKGYIEEVMNDEKSSNKD